MGLQQLSLSKACGIAAYSTALWAVGAVNIKHFGPYLLDTGLHRSLTMAASVPTSYILVRTVDKFFSINSAERLTAMTVFAAVPLLLDGIAFSFVPKLYENDQLSTANPRSACIISRAGAAWLLYGVGMCLTVVLLTQ